MIKIEKDIKEKKSVKLRVLRGEKTKENNNIKNIPL